MPPAGNPELTDMMAAVARGDRQGLARLYAATSSQLFGVALRIMKRRDRAEEVLQDAFVSIWQRARDYDAAKGSVMTWMASIVRNRAIDVLRGNRPSVSLDDAPGQETWPTPVPTRSRRRWPAPRPGACAAVSTRWTRNRARRSCSPTQGLTQEELAGKLDAPLGTIRAGCAAACCASRIVWSHDPARARRTGAAGERYALGTLAGDERARFERALTEHVWLQQRVDEWSRRRRRSPKRSHR